MMTRKRLVDTALAGGVGLVFVLSVQACSSTESAIGFHGTLHQSAPNQADAGVGDQTAPRFDQPDEAMRFFLEQRLGPDMAEIPQEHLLATLRQVVAREQVLRSTTTEKGARRGINSWQSIGPGNIGGRTRAIVIDPVVPDTMYAAGVAGGVFKSTDGGAAWFPTDHQRLLPGAPIS